MTHVAYLSHPLGDIDTMGQRGDNIENAGRWLTFLVEHTRWAIMCPWLAYSTMLSRTIYGPRALTDQITLLERCDFLVQIGGWISPHMDIEQKHAMRNSMPIINLTEFGNRPAEHQVVRDAIAKALRKQADLVRVVKKKRVWMPPLEDVDVEALRAAQVALHADPFSDDARALIQRIVHAALKPT